MEICLIRHTTPNVSKETCYGQTDITLAQSFVEEINKVLSQLPSHHDIVYSSPLCRCTQLAKVIDPKYTVDNRLMELNFGRWEMKRWNAIERKELDPWMANYFEVAPPEGENMNDLTERVIDFLDYLLKKNYASAILVTHGGVIKVIMGLINRSQRKDWMNFKVDYGEVIKVKVDVGNIVFNYRRS